MPIRFRPKRHTCHVCGPLVALAGFSGLAFVLRFLGAGANPHYQYDEACYVAAAQTWLGLKPGAGAVYTHAALHPDPNGLSAPALGKLPLAATIHVLCSVPWGWRLPGAVAAVATWWMARTLFPSRGTFGSRRA
jgi:hypothetical protein